MTGKEIEVGEFVRTIYGEIFKIVSTTKQKEKYVFVDKNVDRYEDRAENDNVLNITEIVKHSKNLIDLIEVGDYVNGMLVVNIVQFSDEINSCFKQILVNRDKDCTLPPLRIIEEDIKTILTKEQYQANCYVVEREE